MMKYLRKQLKMRKDLFLIMVSEVLVPVCLAHHCGPVARQSIMARKV
jgi:hypothetical protein